MSLQWSPEMQLQAYWDDLLGGEPGLPPDEETAEFIRSLHGALPLESPSAAFAGQLRRQFDPDPQPRPEAQSSSVPIAISVPRRSPPDWRLAHWLGAAAVFLLAVGVAIVLSERSWIEDQVGIGQDDETQPAISAPVATSGDVPMYLSNPARTGDASAQLPIEAPVIAWKFSTEGSIQSVPVAVESLVYAGDVNGVFYAVSLKSGMEIWRYQTDQPIRVSAAIDGDRVFVGNGGYTGPGAVYAFNRRDGSLLWRAELPAGVLSDPAVADGAIYLATADGTIYAIDEEDGSVNWQRSSGAPIDSPVAVAGGVVIGASDGGEVIALDTSSGAELWRWSPPLDAALSAVEVKHYLMSQPLMADGAVYVAYVTVDQRTYQRQQSLFAIDVGSGESVWQSPATDSGTISPRTIFLAENLLWVYIVEGSLTGFDPDSGEVQQTLDSRALSSLDLTWAANGVLTSPDGRLWLATSRETGELLWRISMPGTGPYGEPVIAGDSILLGTEDGQLIALQPAISAPVVTSGDVPMYLSNPARTGDATAQFPAEAPSVAWTFDAGGSVQGVPIVVDGLVYAGDANGVFHAVDLETGKERWRFQAVRGIRRSAAVDNDTVFFADGTYHENGTLYALDRRDGRELWRVELDDGVLSDLAVTNGTVYVATIAGAVYAVNAANGSIQWQKSTGAAITKPVAVGEGIVAVADESGLLTAFDSATGDELWIWSVPLDETVDPEAGQHYVWSQPLIADGAVFITYDLSSQYPIYYQQALTALDIDSGTVRWSSPEGQSNYQARLDTIFFDGGAVWWQSDEFQLTSVDPTNGTILEQVTITGIPILESTAWDEQGLLARWGPRTLAGVDLPSGSRSWLISVPENSISPTDPVIAGDYILLGTEDGQLIALRSSDP